MSNSPSSSPSSKPRTAAEKLIDAAKNDSKKDVVDLSTDEALSLTTEEEKQKLKSSVDPLTVSQLNKLKINVEAVMDKTAETFQANPDKNDKIIELMNLADSLKKSPTPTATGTASDFFVDKPQEKKGVMDKVQDFIENTGFVGGIMKAYIAVEKMWMQFFGKKDDPKTLEKIQYLEGLSGKFFGARDTRDVCNKTLEKLEVPITFVKGNNDATSYVGLRKEWNEKRSKEIADADKDAASLALIESENTYENYLAKKVKAYADTFPPAASTTPNTTLYALLKGQEPV